MPWREILINHQCFSNFKNADRQKSKKFNGREKTRKLIFFLLLSWQKIWRRKIYFSFSLLVWLSAIFSHSFSIKREAHRMRVCKYLKMQSWGLKFEFFRDSRDLKNHRDVCFDNCSLNEDKCSFWCAHSS